MALKLKREVVVRSKFLTRKDSLTGEIVAVIAPNGLQVGLSESNSVSAEFNSYGKSKFYEGLSGSLTQLTDGTSYLVAGSNVTISSASNGAVTISSTAGGGSSGPSFFSSTTAGSIFTTGSATFVGGAAATDAPSDQGADVFFFVSGSIDSLETSNTGSAVFGGDVYASGTTILSGTSHQAIPKNFSALGGGAGGFMFSGIYPNMITLDVTGSGDNAFIELGHMFSDAHYPYALTGSKDAFLYVSGAIGSQGTSTRGTAVFSGDVYGSGSIKAELGLSGSLTQLVDGTSYLVAGSNMTITSASNGQVTLAAAGGSGSPGGSDTQIQYNNGGSFGGVASLTFDDSSGHLTVIDDKKLQFGTGNDASIEYDEDGNDVLAIDGAATKFTVAGVEIENSATAGAAALTIDNDDTNMPALFIDAANINQDVIIVSADALTTQKVIDISADGLTTGGILNLVSDSSDNSPRSLVKIHNDNTAAVQVTSLNITNDAAGTRQDVFISTATTTGDVFDINCDSLTTGHTIDVSADGLTTGGILNLVSDSSDTSDRTLVKVTNDNTGATGTTVMHLKSDAVTDDNPILLIESTAADTGPVLELRNANAGVNREAILKFTRSDTSAEADDMDLGRLQFQGADSGNNDTVYVTILAEASDVTSGDEGGFLKFRLFSGGTGGTAASNTLFSIGGEDVANSTPCEVVVNEDGIDCNFRAESDNNTHMLYVDAGDDTVTVGADDSLHKDGFAVINDYQATTFENKLADGEFGSGEILKFSPGADDTLTAGQLFFLNTDGTWDNTDADAVTKGATQLLGIGLGGSARTVGCLIKGFIRIPSTEILNVPVGGAVDGLPVYVSTTGGHFDFTAPSGTGDFVRIVGYAIDDDSGDVLIYFNPDNTFVEIA